MLGDAKYLPLVLELGLSNDLRSKEVLVIILVVSFLLLLDIFDGHHLIINEGLGLINVQVDQVHLLKGLGLRLIY